MAISPFSSCRNVRRGRALGGERKAERNKGKAEKIHAVHIMRSGRAGKEDISCIFMVTQSKAVRDVKRGCNTVGELNVTMKVRSFQFE